MATTLYLEPTRSTPPKCTPNLMPFHIGYSGPAPVSTYFRVKTALPPSYGSTKESGSVEADSNVVTETVSESQETLITDSPAIPEASSSATLPVTASASSATLVNDEVSATAEGVSQLSLQRHYTAAFRGRTMHGLQVDLPEGYGGLVFRSPGANEITASDNDTSSKRKGKTRAKDADTGLSGRRSRGVRAVEEADEDVEMHVAEGEEEYNELKRVLQPTGTFSSFILWNPDVPVDEGRDEYVRSLTEWMKLSAEIHRCED
ncbi:hypothetical protein EIP91_006850 [Steccherinum ochraceum]|uniref:Uncharacterized protein n=1 Tax=Steccherinum ochraceum TaxID=92696 RepID=A0A4R0RTA7_9APHY|nr:hypothetical protein EIP91_006850 [Steccherinum ochraceum]